MRANIRDIIGACNCAQDMANLIEQRINKDFLLDWSQCTMKELNLVAREVHKKINAGK